MRKPVLLVCQQVRLQNNTLVMASCLGSRFEPLHENQHFAYAKTKAQKLISTFVFATRIV